MLRLSHIVANNFTLMNEKPEKLIEFAYGRIEQDILY